MSRKKAFRPIGISRARTAFGFLRDVQRTILADPQSVDMTTVVGDPTAYDDEDIRRPACGVVGCFGGWIGLKSMGRELSLGNGSIAYARHFLGAGMNYLFGGPDGDAYYVFNAGAGDSCATTEPGTKAHARAVVQRINRFIKKNETALRARKLVAAADGTLSPAPDQI